MMRLTHFDGLRTNKTSSLKSTVFDTKEYINTRDKVRKNLTCLTTTNSYERIKNTRTGSNSLLPIELDDVPESCIPLYAHPEQRELYLELTRYADNPKMTVKDILIPLSHTLLMEQKYKASDLVLEKLSRPTKMKFVYQFITHIDRGSWKTYQINILCNDHSMEYLLYETAKQLNLDCKRFRDHYGRDNQHLYGVLVQSKDPGRISSRPDINLLLVYDSAIPPDIRTQQIFMSIPSSPLFIVYLTLVNTAEIRLFNYINRHPNEDITWSTPLCNLSTEAKKCLLTEFDYTAVDPDREWNEYMSKKAYKWSLVDQKTPFRETRTRPKAFISKNQYQVRPRHRYSHAGNVSNEIAPEIMTILTQVLYGNIGSSKSSGKKSPVPRGPRHLSSPPRGYDIRDSSIELDRSAWHSRPPVRVSKDDEDVSTDTMDEEYVNRGLPSPYNSSTSSSIHEESSSVNRRNPAPTGTSLEKSIDSKSYKRVSSLEREESSKRRILHHPTREYRLPYDPATTLTRGNGQFLKFSLATMIPEPVYHSYALSASLHSRRRPQDESGPAHSPKSRILTSPKPEQYGNSRDPRLSPNRDPRVSLSSSGDTRSTIFPPPVTQTVLKSRDPRRQIPSNRPAEEMIKKKEVEENKKGEEEERARRVEEARKKIQDTIRMRGEEAKKKAEEIRRQKVEETLRKQKEEELRKQIEEEIKKQRTEEALRKQKEEEKIRIQKEEEIRKQKEEALKKQKEEEIRNQKEEGIRKQKEEEARKQRKEELQKRKEDEARKKKEEELQKQKAEEIRQQKEKELRKQMEEQILKHKEEEIRKEIEEEIRKKKEGEIRKRIEEEVRKKILEEMRKEEEDKKRAKEEEKKKQAEQKEDANTNTLSSNDDTMSDFEKALEKIHLEFQAALRE